MSLYKFRPPSGLKHILQFLGILCACVMLFSSSVSAQTNEQGGFISAQDVYENPDDHTLNLEYAKQEIRRGELLNAASALERMLYANPNWHSARLLYSDVLYRLDDSQAALNELSHLKGRELNEKQTQRYERYLGDFKTPLPKRTSAVSARGTGISNGYTPHDRVVADVAIGIRADNNAGNALTDESFGFNNQGDISLHAQGRLRFNTPLSKDSSVTARGAIGGQIRRHETFSQADYDVIDVQAGLSARPSGKGRISLDIDARRVNISGEKYLDQIGPRVTYDQSISGDTLVSVSLSAYAQDYDPLSFASLEDERDGVRTRLQLGLQKNINRTQKITAVIGFDTKSADISAFAYDGPQASIIYEHRFKDNHYLKTNIHARQLNYGGSLEPTIDRRKDTRLAFRQAFGVPLIVTPSNSGVKKLDLEFGINLNARLSNIEVNDFENLGADIKLKFKF